MAGLERDRRHHRAQDDSGIGDFLLKLGQDFCRRIEDADSLVWHVVSTIAEYLVVDGCMFSEIDLVRGMNTMHRDYARVACRPPRAPIR